MRLAFTGDISLGQLAGWQDMKTGLPDWPALRDAIGDYDFLVGNLECCLVDDSCSPDARKQAMATPLVTADVLRSTGFTDLNLANNHMLDCGHQSIKVTRKRLAELDIRMFGAGANRDEAEQTVLTQNCNYTVALLGACDVSEYYASDNRPGIAPLKKSRLGRRVREAAAQADLVVVTLHADLEFCEAPAPWRRRLSHWLVRQGAHLIIQHHPHVLQGVEMYRGALIAYSLGNFVFRLRGNSYQERESGVFESLVLVVDADMSGANPALSYRIVPARIGDDHTPHCLTGPSAAQAIERFKTLSSLSANPRECRRVWFQRCRTEIVRRLFSIYYAVGRGNLSKAFGEVRWLFTRREDHRWLLGLMSFGFW